MQCWSGETFVGEEQVAKSQKALSLNSRILFSFHSLQLFHILQKSNSTRQISLPLRLVSTDFPRNLCLCFESLPEQVPTVEVFDSRLVRLVLNLFSRLPSDRFSVAPKKEKSRKRENSCCFFSSLFCRNVRQCDLSYKTLVFPNFLNPARDLQGFSPDDVMGC